MDINELPLEILEKILENLDVKERLKVSRVSQRWFAAALRTINELSDGDLDRARRSYKMCYKQDVDLWSLFHLFPKCRILDIFFPLAPNESNELDALGSHLGQLEELRLAIFECPADYDWKQLGSRLTKLASLDLTFYTDDRCNYCDMIRVCPFLTKIELYYAVITDKWNKAIPKQVTNASFDRCRDDRSTRNEGLFSFLFEHIQSLVKLKWTAGRVYGNLKDLVGLVNLRDLTLDVDSNVNAAAFEHCKQLKTLKVDYLHLEALKCPRHILPVLEKLKIRDLDGEEDNLKLFCPKLVDLQVQRNDFYTG